MLLLDAEIFPSDRNAVSLILSANMSNDALCHWAARNVAVRRTTMPNSMVGRRGDELLMICRSRTEEEDQDITMEMEDGGSWR